MITLVCASEMYESQGACVQTELLRHFLRTGGEERRAVRLLSK